MPGGLAGPGAKFSLPLHIRPSMVGSPLAAEALAFTIETLRKLDRHFSTARFGGWQCSKDPCELGIIVQWEAAVPELVWTESSTSLAWTRCSNSGSRNRSVPEAGAVMLAHLALLRLNRWTAGRSLGGTSWHRRGAI